MKIVLMTIIIFSILITGIKERKVHGRTLSMGDTSREAFGSRVYGIEGIFSKNRSIFSNAVFLKEQSK